MTTDRPVHRPIIDVLHVEDCPNYPDTLALVQRVGTELAEADTEPDQDERAGVAPAPTRRQPQKPRPAQQRRKPSGRQPSRPAKRRRR